MARIDTEEDALIDEYVIEAQGRGIIEIKDDRVIYNVNQKKDYDWTDPEEWVRARTISYLVIAKDYPANRLRTEVVVPRRTPSDYADVVLYEDDKCHRPYLVVENKAAGQSKRDRAQGIEQGFGNANSLRAPYVLYDEFATSTFFDVTSFPPTERTKNILGTKDAIPSQYGEVPEFVHIAGKPGDIEAIPSSALETRIRRAHSIIWAGGKRDPLTAFDEWSKLLFAKVMDERSTPTGSPRQFQVGPKETTAAVANRIHRLFKQGCRDDPTIFQTGTRINLPDKKVSDVVSTIQAVSFIRTDVDSIGHAFENFFGSVFRGGLGQYFTMRSLARFTVVMVDISHEDFVIDPAAGSGGFLLETLLQVWHGIDEAFRGQPVGERERLKYDFAKNRVYGIEVHEILARICKINLLLHHDGHTNIEGDRSCLDSIFTLPRLNPPREKFTRLVGNPPFGDDVEEGDEDQLGSSTLSDFTIAKGRRKVDSEHIILERSIQLLEPEGRLGLVVPDGVLNNQGERSNCPQTRMMLTRSGYVEAIVSLPDYAFRKSGAQNKTSILFFRKFSKSEKRRFDKALERARKTTEIEAEAIASAYSAFDCWVFLAEANHVGYTPTGAPSNLNDLYRADAVGRIIPDQSGTILGEYRRFLKDPAAYQGTTAPDCMAMGFTELWNEHPSRRLDPKYYLFKREEMSVVPDGWVRKPLREVMHRREDIVTPESQPDQHVRVMTIAQTGDIRPREAGKGRNPPEWIGSYFEDMPATWYAARAGDVVYSSIDLWKGCIAVVPQAFDGALVTNEFPIYEVKDSRLDPEFLSYLLRTRYYQRAFRAITTGHSNRRRTQTADFENLEISFPPHKKTQRQLVSGIRAARKDQRNATDYLSDEMAVFSNVIDGRGEDELPEIESEPVEA